MMDEVTEKEQDFFVFLGDESEVPAAQPIQIDDESQAVIIRSILLEQYKIDETPWEARARFHGLLEQAMIQDHRYIVIEPAWLGRNSSLWLYIRNLLDSSVRYLCYASLIIGSFFPRRAGVYGSCLIAALGASIVYHIFYRGDALNKYETIDNIAHLNLLPIDMFQENPEPVVLALDNQEDGFFKRSRIQRVLLYISGFYFFYRYLFPPIELCNVPVSMVPKNPYPYHPRGTGKGFWVPSLSDETTPPMQPASDLEPLPDIC